MKSEWKVLSNIIGDIKIYGVYRLLDTAETDHSGNREVRGSYNKNREKAEEYAALLNAEDEDE